MPGLVRPAVIVIAGALALLNGGTNSSTLLAVRSAAHRFPEESNAIPQAAGTVNLVAAVLAFVNGGLKMSIWPFGLSATYRLPAWSLSPTAHRFRTESCRRPCWPRSGVRYRW